MPAMQGKGGDIFHMNLHGYSRFVADCQLADPNSVRCKKSHLDNLFIAVTTQVNKSNLSLYNKRTGLNYQEWLRVLVRLAVKRHLAPGQEAATSAADALAMLFRDDLSPRLPAAATHDSNRFREEHCYTEQTDLVLRSFEPSLRLLFRTYSALVTDGTATVEKTFRTDDLNFEQWTRFNEHFALRDTRYTFKEVSLAFSWSRMVVVDEASVEARHRLTHLSFEDFLEALVRAAKTRFSIDEARRNAARAKRLRTSRAAVEDGDRPDDEDEAASSAVGGDEPVCVRLGQLFDLMTSTAEERTGVEAHPAGAGRKQINKHMLSRFMALF